MKSYQAIDLVPSKDDNDLSHHTRDVVAPKHTSRMKKKVGALLLSAGVIGLIMSLYNSTMRQSLEQMIPLEMEGASLSGNDKETNHNKLKDGCEATIMIIRHCEKGSLRKHWYVPYG
jgi:hypothetical protein